MIKLTKNKNLELNFTYNYKKTVNLSGLESEFWR